MMRQPQNLSRKHVYLIGFSGSGKSAVGAGLAERLGARFIDIDKEIATRLGATIPCIFEQHGERRFRAGETAVIRHVSRLKTPAVIAVGGGGVERAENRRIMQRSGVLVYLRCSMRELCRRLQNADDRPLLGEGRARRESIRRLLVRRKPMYETADITVCTTHDSPREVVEKIAKRLAECDHTDNS